MIPESHCTEFDLWIKRLPRQELSPELQHHLTVCSKCASLVEGFQSTVSLLNREIPINMPNEYLLKQITEKAHQELTRLQAIRLAWKLVFVCLCSLPVVFGINWLWASLGYSVFASTLSPFAGQLYVTLFCIAAIVMAGLTYSLIPVLAGWFYFNRGMEHKT